MRWSEHHDRTRLALFLVVLFLLGATLVLVYSSPIRNTDAAAERSRYETDVEERWFRQCEELLTGKEFDKAEIKLRQILYSLPESSRARRLQARIKLLQGKSGEAEKIYREILYSSPLDEISRNNLGVLYFARDGRRQEAETEIRQAWMLGSDNPVIAYNYKLITGAEKPENLKLPEAGAMDILVAAVPEDHDAGRKDME